MALPYPQTAAGSVSGPMQFHDVGLSQKNAIEKARLPQQLDQLEKVLITCLHAANGIAVATDRILGPVPQAGETVGKPPAPSTIEHRFAETIGTAEQLSNQLHNCLQRLNSAV